MLQLLGTPRLRSVRLMPPRAGLLAYLALQGTTSRNLLSQLLWPDQSLRTAQNNLAQALMRLRKSKGGPCLAGRDPLSIAEGLAVDVKLLAAAVGRRDYAEAIRYGGALLEGCEFDELDPDARFHRWLQGQRARIEDLQCDARLGRIRQLEQERRYLEAREMAQESCSRFPAKDGPWLALMRVHQAMGEPRASQDVYREYLAVLEREGGTPSQEVTQYASMLEHLRPPPRRPRLVGRERELAEMEAAYQERKSMFVFGEPGVGKSRLIEEFAASKGKWIALGAKPGDATIPYASHVRNGQALLARRKEDGRPPLPTWVQEQLAHHLGGPELGMARRADPPSQVTSAFLDAAAELLRDTCKDMAVVVFDDGQYIDPESFYLGMYIHNKLPGWNTPDGEPFPLIVNGYRTGAIQQDWLDIIRDLAHQGQVALIELQPLDGEDVAELLRGMNLPGLEEHAALLARYSGGNPLYLVEMVKTLRQEGWVPGTRLPYRKLAKSVKDLIRRQLTWLSSLARSIARVVAVAQTNTSPEAVVRVLGKSPAELVEAYRELEERGVLQGDWFTHDLFGEVILEDVPEALRDVLRPQA